MSHPIPTMDPERARVILGLPLQFDLPELRQNYLAAVKLAHPDQNQGHSEWFLSLTEAYHLLGREQLVAPSPTSPAHPAEPTATHADLRSRDGVLVRGRDVWMDARIDGDEMPVGRRLAVETPQGRRIIWITAAASARGLVRLPGQGLPADDLAKAGDLFLRLTPLRRNLNAVTCDLMRHFEDTWMV